MKIGEGNTSELIKEDNKVIKKFNEHVQLKTIEKEAKAAKLLQEIDLETPEYFGIRTIQGRQSIVYEHIKGDSLLDLMIKEHVTVEEAAEEFALLHQHMHTQTGEGLPGLVAELEKEILKSEEINEREKEQLLKDISQKSTGDRLCHMDYHPGNVLWTGQKSVVIDWLTGCQGPPEADVARTIIILNFAVLPDNYPEERKDAFTAIRRELFAVYLECYFEEAPFRFADVKPWMTPLMVARLNEKIPALEKEWLRKEIKASFSSGT
ncbi:phosphotransferase family protein [Thalassobacillus pellis]|uniref:phosphotransferase family protein n=1 Tax=Thalassobacillus pellis TaxID=748008 RepID=UPI001961DA17|nr:aminoglycoside phosphotransferase family protein [Thalassobacillus pellis]MBM7551161.1 thiamine kinase-like enzyme [Thalassobacillus pellis]